METKRNLRVRNAIKLAIGASLAVSTVSPFAIAADEEEAARLERIQVTGSRISRLDVEGATPVVIISREDLDNSGFQSVADFLRSSSFNSFGSFSESSGTTWQGQATLNLRGVGSSRTLVLIDGKRLPGSPVMDGQIQNLNTIPFAAVERIEILSDGASAIYGSDAIGGVVNVILRRNFEGGEVTVRGTRPDRDGGAERGASIVAGFGGDRGRVTFAIEADHQDTTLNRDRWFTANQFLGGDPSDVNNYNNLSFYGRNIVDFKDPTFVGTQAVDANGNPAFYPNGDPVMGVQDRDANGNPRVDANGNPVLLRAAGQGTFNAYSMIEGPGSDACGLYGQGFWNENLIDSDFTGATAAEMAALAADTGRPFDLAYPNGIEADYGCFYDYTGVAATTAQLDRLSAFMTAEYEINSDVIFTTQIMAARVESWGRYAPAAAPVTWSGAALPARTVMIDGSSYTLNPIDTGDRIYFRWNNVGDARDTWQNDYQFDIQVGLQGFYDGIQWTTNYQYDLYDMAEWGNGYIQNLGVAYVAENFGFNPATGEGWDPRHPDQAQYGDLLGNIAANSNRRAQMIMQRVDLGAQFDGPMMAAGPSMFFVGGEYRDEQYFDEALAQMEAFNIGGTSGGSSGGSRSAWAVFSEASLPLFEGFELTPAVRYDSYNDFGTNVSYKLAARFQPVDYWLLRASFGTGFRAPSLDELYQAPSQSFEFADDLGLCEQNGIDPATCLAQTNQQYETYFNANPDLDPEQSTQYLLGTVFDFNQFNGLNLTVSLDYYYTEVEDVITTVTSQDAFWLEYLGMIDQYPAVTVNRLPNGRHDTTQVAPINFAQFDTSGLDLRVNYGLTLGAMGDLSFGLQYTKVLEYNSSDQLVGPQVNIVGRRGVPAWRANLDVAWTLGRHTVSLTSFFVPSQCESSMLQPNADP